MADTQMKLALRRWLRTGHGAQYIVTELAQALRDLQTEADEFAAELEDAQADQSCAKDAATLEALAPTLET